MVFDWLEVGSVKPGMKKNVQFFTRLGKKEQICIARVKPVTIKNSHCLWSATINKRHRLNKQANEYLNL